jgi:hypothetical protein
MARRPSHDDTTGLSIREMDDGRVLINDFGGCAAAEILASLNLEFDARFGLHSRALCTRREDRASSHRRKVPKSGKNRGNESTQPCVVKNVLAEVRSGCEIL